MSFKDLTTRVAAAIKPKTAEAAKAPAKENESTTAGKETPAKSKTT